MSEGKKLVVSILVVTVVLSSLSLWLFTGLRKCTQLDGEVAKKTDTLGGLREKIAKIPELRIEQNELKEELNEYETILPNDAELNALIDTLDDYRKKAEIEIVSFEPLKERARGAKENTEASYRKVSYDLDLQGDYFTLVKFINLLENHDRFIQVDSFSIKAPSKDDSSINDVDLRISTFVYNPKSKPVKHKTTSRPSRTSAKPQKKAPEVPFRLKDELEQRYVFGDVGDLRDPFINPLTKHVNVGPLDRGHARRTDLKPAEEKQLVDQIEAQLVGVQKLLDRHRVDEAAKLVAQTRDLMDVEFRDPEAYRKQFRFARDAQKLEFYIRHARGRSLCEVVRGQMKKMEQAFGAGDYETVYDIRDAIKEAVADAGADVISDEIATLQKSCEQWCDRADTRQEFAGMVINIEATFWAGKRGARRAAAIVNGQTIMEGDVLSRTSVKAKSGKPTAAGAAAADVVVKSIGRSGITFQYKDELIEMPLENR